MTKICLVCKKKYEISSRVKKSQRDGSKFCSSKCYGLYRKKEYRLEKSGHWKGGITYANGYKYVFKPEHPNSTKTGYIMEHRLVAEKKLGRYLDPINEVVHHLDGNKLNNNPNNLMVQTRAEHLLTHLDSLISARPQKQ